ncbi:hypothetical protein BDN72DRAFT_576078 [Pluteus cervinus]|uniref:Uncharacterized protein n=1 Tax=Pluteus cervinus TaxID=181527 RepID=A0ACD3AWL5_9AGAR|nr:hypothetical protein BDN72DRAFT_576078 [Pluteus cervinus]
MLIVIHYFNRRLTCGGRRLFQSSPALTESDLFGNFTSSSQYAGIALHIHHKGEFHPRVARPHDSHNRNLAWHSTSTYGPVILSTLSSIIVNTSALVLFIKYVFPAHEGSRVRGVSGSHCNKIDDDLLNDSSNVLTGVPVLVLRTCHKVLAASGFDKPKF